MAWKTDASLKLARVATATMVITLISSLGWAAFPPADVHCAGDYQHHLQGVCTNEVDAIYWSFTTELVKTDQRGKSTKWCCLNKINVLCPRNETHTHTHIYIYIYIYIYK